MIQLQNLKNYLTVKGGLSESEFEFIRPFVQIKTFTKNQFLLQQGDVCSHFFFVEKGLLRLYDLNADGKENILQFAPENWIVSDRGSIFFQEPSAYCIDAIEDSTIILLDIPFLHEIAKINSDFSTKNEQLLQNHIRHLYKRISQLLGASARERYLDFIKMYPDMLKRVPQWMIASYLGITPESLSRVRKALAKENFKPT